MFHIITLTVGLVTLDFMGSIISQFPSTFPGKNFVIWYQLNEKTRDSTETVHVVCTNSFMSLRKNLYSYGSYIVKFLSRCVFP